MIEQDDRDKPFPVTQFSADTHINVPFDFKKDCPWWNDQKSVDKQVLEVIDEKYRKILELDFYAGEQ